MFCNKEECSLTRVKGYSWYERFYQYDKDPKGANKIKQYIKIDIDTSLDPLDPEETSTLDVYIFMPADASSTFASHHVQLVRVGVERSPRFGDSYGWTQIVAGNFERHYVPAGHDLMFTPEDDGVPPGYEVSYRVATRGVEAGDDGDVAPLEEYGSVYDTREGIFELDVSKSSRMGDKYQAVLSRSIYNLNDYVRLSNRGETIEASVAMIRTTGKKQLRSRADIVHIKYPICKTSESDCGVKWAPEDDE